MKISGCGKCKGPEAVCSLPGPGTRGPVGRECSEPGRSQGRGCAAQAFTKLFSAMATTGIALRSGIAGLTFRHGPLAAGWKTGLGA